MKHVVGFGMFSRIQKSATQNKLSYEKKKNYFSITHQLRFFRLELLTRVAVRMTPFAQQSRILLNVLILPGEQQKFWKYGVVADGPTAESS